MTGIVEMRRAFTLLELLVVMVIMGAMGVLTVASYRSMKQSMSDSAVVRSAGEFIRMAYQRADIDRVPVNIYFWNETRSVETEDTKLSVAGRAVAVRKAGRFTCIANGGKLLVDEFGDLEAYAATDEDGERDESASADIKDIGMYLYRINGDEGGGGTIYRSVVTRSTYPHRDDAVELMSYPDSAPKSITAYGYYQLEGGNIGDWQVGDAYGLEIGEFELPEQYIFESSYSESIDSPRRDVKVMHIDPAGIVSGLRISIYALRLDKQGEFKPLALPPTEDPTSQR